jgi:hypothetical protein
MLLFMGYWLLGRRREDSFPVIVDSLNVPTSPLPHVPRHRTGHIRGRATGTVAISTERTQSLENHPLTFCVLLQLT